MGKVPCPSIIACGASSRAKSQPPSDSSALSSQPSLPSVPSLTSSSHPPHSSSTRHQCVATLKDHSCYVFSLAIAGRSLYSGSSDGQIRVWNMDTLDSSSSSTLVAEVGGAIKLLVACGDKLISAHQDHKIRLWRMINRSDVAGLTHKLVATLPTLRDRLLRYLPPKNHVQVRRHHTRTWVHHVDAVSGMSLSRDASALYSVSWDRTLKKWGTSDHACLESVGAAHDDAINAVVVSVDGYVYTGSADTRIKVWSKGKGEKKLSLVATLEKHKSAINALALSSDGSVLYSGACDRSIVVWEREGGGANQHMVVVGALRGHAKAILCLAAMSDLVCSGSADRTVRIWRRELGKCYSCIGVLEGHKGPVKCLAVTAGGCSSRTFGSYNNSSSSSSCLVFSGSLDCDIKVWQLLIPSVAVAGGRLL